MWGEGGSKEFFLFFPSFFLLRSPYYKAWRGRSDDGFVEGSVDTCIPDVKKEKKARKKEKEKKDNTSSAWFNSMVLYFIKT